MCASIALQQRSSLEFDTDPTIQTAWTTEAKRRRDETEVGLFKRFQGKKLWLKCGDFLSNEVLVSSLLNMLRLSNTMQSVVLRQAFIDVVEDAVYRIRESLLIGV